MKNRIAFSPDAAFKAAYIGHLDALITMGNTMIAGTSPDDIKGGQKMGDGGGLAFVKDGWASNFNELLADALRRFLESHSARVTESMVVSDVQWGLHGDD